MATSLKILCKQGLLEVENGTLRLTTPFRKLIWSIPCHDIIGLTIWADTANTVTLTLHTTCNHYQVETILPTNVEKLQAHFPALNLNRAKRLPSDHD